jgi:hypothetical protein
MMQIERNQDIGIIRIEGDIQQQERELQGHLSNLITNGISKIILDIRDAELDMSHRDLFEDVVISANHQVQQKEGEIVFLASVGKKINLRIPDSLGLEKFYMEGQATEFLQESHK